MSNHLKGLAGFAITGLIINLFVLIFNPASFGNFIAIIISFVTLYLIKLMDKEDKETSLEDK